MIKGGCGTASITVAIAGHSHLVRRGLRAVIETAHDIALIGEVATVAEATDLIAVQRPQQLVIQMEPGLDIRGLTRQIKTVAPGMKLIVLLNVKDNLRTWDLVGSGVNGIVLSNQPPAVLLTIFSTYQ